MSGAEPQAPLRGPAHMRGIMCIKFQVTQHHGPTISLTLSTLEAPQDRIQSASDARASDAEAGGKLATDHPHSADEI
jgi:hypothetical protein